ncbi:MAG: zinc-ribbon domain-containing protein [Spirochaetales bacterium]|nr:zinc-ribbon domain-containing protein [Spirochaetales bacterium]
MNTPSFFCENCGREVSDRMEVCPGCGQEFSSVRCPTCGFTGKPELFKKSCPECGYVGEDVIDKTRGSKLVKSESNEFKNSRESENHLPYWLYKVLIGILVIIIIYLVRVYFLL